MEKKVSFNVVDIIALYALTIALAIKLIAAFAKIKESTEAQLLTSAIAIDSIVLAYYFVSTKSSQTKDATILSMQEDKAKQLPTKVETINTENIENVTTDKVVTQDSNEKPV